MSEHSYHKLYDRLVDEVKTLYYANQVRIHKGLWALIISTVLFLTNNVHHERLEGHLSADVDRRRCSPWRRTSSRWST